MKGNSPRVSVIVPNYNHSKFLRQRIDSILQQSYQDFEVILLDDCSTDNSKDILASYADNPHVSTILINEKNSGSPFKQWERGMEFAKGEFIWIAESDDTADPSFLEELMTPLANTPNAVLAFSHSYLIDTDGNVMEGDLHNNSGDQVDIYNGRIFCRQKMTTHNYIHNASMVVFRLSAYQQLDKEYYQQFRACGDWAFWVDICLQGKVIEVCKKLSCFRIHPNKVTTTTKTDNAWNEVAVILTDFIRHIPLKGLSLHLFRGKWTRDILLSKISDKEEFVGKYPEVFGASKTDVLLYRLSCITQKF